jgi:peptidoglycan/LPS O-acetylase OafA/YrhL
VGSTFFPAVVSGPAHLWSLAVEEHFYLFWPFLVLALSRQALLRATVGAILMSFALRLLLARFDPIYFTPCRLDGLAMGSAMAILIRRGPEGLSTLVMPARWLLLLLTPALGALQYVVSGMRLDWVQILKPTLVGLLCASAILLALENRLGRVAMSILKGKALGSVGKFSYAMYLFHPFIEGGLKKFGLTYSLTTLILNIAVTYAAAWISWNLFESRFLRLKHRFEYRESPVAQSIASVSL